jgi:hypothetical protein
MMKCIVSVVCTVLITHAVRAQVDVASQASPDKSATRSDVSISTMDRSMVPLIIESKTKEIAPNTSRTDATTKARLNDGSYFDFRDTTTVQKQIDSNTTTVVQDIKENDRQGGARVLRKTDSTIQKTPTGEVMQEKQYRRNSSGGTVLETVVDATTVKRPDGSSATTTVQKSADVNGTLRLEQQTEQTVRPISATEKQVTTQVLQMDHMENQFKLIARETSTVRTEGNTTRSDTVVQQQSGDGWRNVGKITTTEARTPDGRLKREIIEEGQTLYSKLVPKADESLQSMRKVVETEVRQPDGTVRLQRDVFRRDVNGEWKAQTFSTEGISPPTASPTAYTQ